MYSHHMRTTLTLDPDVAEKLRQAGKSGNKTQREIINEALQRGLGGGTAARRKPFRVKAHASAYCPGIDRLRLNQIADDLATEAFLPSKPRGEKA